MGGGGLFLIFFIALLNKFCYYERNMKLQKGFTNNLTSKSF